MTDPSILTAWSPYLRAWQREMRAAGRSPGTIRTRTAHLRHVATATPAADPLTVTRAQLVTWQAPGTWPRRPASPTALRCDRSSSA